jgi:hypothetical protein
MCAENLTQVEINFSDGIIDIVGEEYRDEITDFVYSSLHPLFKEIAYKDSTDFGDM